MNEEKRLYVTHVNIRLSISFLLLKLVLIELFSGAVIILLHVGMASYVNTADQIQQVVIYGMPILICLILIKLFIVIFVIMQWLNEYYEISPGLIKYRRGILFRKVDNFPVGDIKFIDVEQGFWGRMFNFGTITLRNIRRVEYAQMYQIHNPIRYAEVIEGVVPHLVERRKIMRRRFHEENDREESAEEEME